ncbi:MAG: hypothetical protein ACOX5F_04630 [Anaerovoracaceae bacterium]|jgi:predicted house-cleaning noncanonical NTP pyrophosphatase (MazG superfamily)
MKRQYNKLVRDNIPKLIEESGRKSTYKVLNDHEYHEALIDKIIEEITEFRESNKEEEIADIYEALDCLVRLNEFEPMHIDYLRLIKREARGSFNDKIFLIDVED